MLTLRRETKEKGKKCNDVRNNLQFIWCDIFPKDRPRSNRKSEPTNEVEDKSRLTTELNLQYCGYKINTLRILRPKVVQIKSQLFPSLFSNI